MKKAKIILTCLALFAILGGALAFKASRTVRQVFTYTSLYVQTGSGITVTYKLPNNASFCTTTRGLFWTNVFQPGITTSSAYLTTAPATTSIVLTSGTLSKTIPSYTCVPTTTYTTTIF